MAEKTEKPTDKKLEIQLKKGKVLRVKIALRQLY